MTSTATDTSWCSQHRRPLSECRPDAKHVHPIRFRTDMWADAERAAKAAGTDRTGLVTQALEVFGLGYIRCGKCDYRSPDAPPVPVEFGDLTGRPPGYWVDRAAERIAQQHPDHGPVMVGAGRPAASQRQPRRERKAASPVAAEDPRAATVAQLRDKIKEAESRPAAAKTVRFVEPKA